jgi:hypothetical protein
VLKQIRISNLEPFFKQGHYWFNASLITTNILEAQLLHFDISTDSSEDDEIDALAYNVILADGFENSQVDEESDYEDDERVWN